MLAIQSSTRLPSWTLDLALISLPPPGGIVIGRVCWFFRSFVSYNYSKSKSPTFMKFDTDVPNVTINFSRSRSNFKVKTAVLTIFHLELEVDFHFNSAVAQDIFTKFGI